MRVFVNAIVRIKHIMCRKEILHCSYCAIQNRSSNSNDSSKQLSSDKSVNNSAIADIHIKITVFSFAIINTSFAIIAAEKY